MRKIIRNIPKKVIWAEGVLLGQQHFQQWEQYAAAVQQMHLHSAAPLSWGLIDLQIDHDALLNNQFRIKYCEVIFRDGLIVSYDAAHDGILTCPLETTHGPKQDIYLAMPLNQNAKGITGYQNSEQFSSLKASYQNISDLYDASREREVLVAKENLVLLRGHESREQFQAIKIAQVISNGDKGFQLIKNYLPPLVHISNAPFLMDMVKRILEIIRAKIRVLSDNRYQRDDMQQLLLLHILNPSFIELQHYYKIAYVAPEKLYLALSTLFSRLTLFTESYSFEAIPEYQHENLTEIFNKINELLSSIIEIVMPARSAQVQLRREHDSLYMADSIDSLLLEQADFFIAVYFQSEDVSWIEQFAHQVKVGSHSAIENLVTSALTGVKVTHTQRPPNKLSVKPGYEYFYLEQSGDFWEQVKTDKSLALFLPSDFIKAKIELVTVQK